MERYIENIVELQKITTDKQRFDHGQEFKKRSWPHILRYRLVFSGTSKWVDMPLVAFTIHTKHPFTVFD